MPVTLLPGQKVTGTLKPESTPGVPAPVDGIPQWAASNPSVITITPSADGMSVSVTYSSAGVSQVSAVCDADMGSGTRELTILDDVTCGVAEATTLGMEWGTPEAADTQPVPTPQGRSRR